MTQNDTLPCSGCHSPLPLEATGCQICMRARTKQEIMRGYAMLREREARQRRRPYKIAAAVILAAAAAALSLKYGSRFMSVAGPAVRSAMKWADDMRNPENYASKSRPAPPPPAAPAAPGAPVAPEAAVTAQLFPREASPEPAAAPAAPVPAPRPAAASRPLVKGSWRVWGIVYDLATLEPVQGADITFLRDDKEERKVTTDERGGYEADLVKGDGWTVSMEIHDRRPGQIVDIDPPYRLRDPDERRAAFEHVTDGDLAPAPIGWSRSVSKARLDLVAVPSRWDGPGR